MLEPKSLDEWIEIYEKKTKTKAVIRKNYFLFYLANRGFMTAKTDIDSKMLFVELVSGDGGFWRDYAELKATELGLTIIGTICIRPIEAYIRSFGGEILAKQEVDGKFRYLCQDAIGRRVVVTHKCDREQNLPPEYFVTQYLCEKATTSWDDITKGNDENV